MLLSLAVIALASVPLTVADEAVCKSLVDGPALRFERDEKGQLLSEAHSVKIGERLELTCTVFASPTASIIWLHNGKEVQINEGPQEFLFDSRHRTLGISMLKSRLVRDCATAEDAGEYSCIAMSPCAKAIKQTTKVTVTAGKATVCAAQPSITMFTDSRMEYPTVPVQLVCRSSHSMVGVHWVRVDDDDETITSPIEFAGSGFFRLPSGDLIVDPKLLGDDVATVTMRCFVGDDHVDSTIMFMNE
ncbi:zig-5 [Pristionchus pacificus]|uniref:Zig-5 n=1 Tax=Pristionchus pacificus TaxID=54126 RepID=A0A454Y0W8_PRIPA|nr:zig-5 [Pristionchus pacificus]|eukprot:PDM62696.1 zig-5 [Pristionchus pacificus]